MTNTESAPALKPCPLCNGSMVLHDNDWADPPLWRQVCAICGLSTGEYATRELAVERGNRRSGDRDATIEAFQADKDAAYLERNQVVAALASLFPAGIARTDIPGWLPEWHGCVYIDLPTGQTSWHYHDSHAHLFAHLPAYTKPWDGHTTEAKYERLAALCHSGETA